MFFSIGSNKPTANDNAIVLDIGSGSVGGGLIRIDKKNEDLWLNNILREPIKVQDEVKPERLLVEMTKALKILIKKLEEQTRGENFKDIYCLLSSPWHISQTKVISYNKEKPFIFDQSMAEKLAKKEDANFRQSNKGSSEEEFIDKKIIRLRLNGYETHNPKGQSAHQIEISYYLSLAPKEVLEKIRETIEKEFNSAEIQFHSSSLAVFSALRDMFSTTHSFLLVQVSGEMTDVSLIKDNVLSETISFPIGRNDIIRHIKVGTGAPIAHIDSALKLMADKSIHSDSTDKIVLSINKIEESWLTHFRKSLNTLASDFSLPGTVFLLAGKDITDRFAELIKKEKFSQLTFVDSPFKVIPIKSETFSKHCKMKEGKSDLFLAIEAIFVKKMLDL